jgi:N-acetylmuramoyl-L-alanine amidase
MQVREVAEKGCFTGRVEGLSRQLIAEMNLLAPGVLVSFADLPAQPATTAVHLFLQPPAKEALRQAVQERGRTLPVASAYRTVAQQYLLHHWHRTGRCGIVLAAAPGRSNHENGLALDIPTGIPEFESWKRTLQRHGWVWFGVRDRPHFTYGGAAGVRHDLAPLGIRAFQRLWSRYRPADPLKVDGVYGPETARRLGEAPADGFAGPRLLRRRTPPLQGEDVLQLQRALAAAGFPVAADGIYGRETEAAVQRFQEREGLKADGIVGIMTRRALALDTG